MTDRPDSQNTFTTRLNLAVAIVVAFIALLGSFITKIESDASTNASLASNDAQQAYYEAIGKEISGAADVNYAFGTVYQLWYQYNVQLTAAKKRGDRNSIQTYTDLRNSIEKTSPIFHPDYFNSKTGQVNLLSYRANQYGTLVYALREKQRAAGDVAAAWSAKSEKYVLQLTLLAVAGFLLGLSLMSKTKITSLVFALSGMVLVLVISLWAYLVYKPIPFDLRKGEAISYFAKASSLSDQKRWDEALEMFTKAIDAAGRDHPYMHALLGRARVYAALDRFEEAIADYKVAAASEENDPSLNASLIRAYYQTGNFEEAIQIGEAARVNSSEDLWLLHQLNMAILAKGDVQTAARQYQDFMDLATQRASDLHERGGTPSEIWWLIDEATFQLDQLVKLLESSVSSPIKANISDPQTVGQEARRVANLLRARSIALQYNLPETLANSNATLGKPDFEFSKTPDGKYVYKVDMQFSYSGLEPGQLLIIKVYRNGVQDPSWSFNQIWSGKKQDGQTSFTISPAYNSLYIVPPAVYTVDLYINGQIAQQSRFSVTDPNNPNTDEVTEFLATDDMLDQFDFFAEDFFFSDSEDDYAFYFNDPMFFFDSEEDYFTFLSQSYDFYQGDCTDSEDLTCSTETVDCTSNPDVPSCEQPPSLACESDPTLSADDPNCGDIPPSEASTEAPVDETVTEVPTEVATEAAGDDEVPTEAPTEPPAEDPTEPPSGEE